MLPSKVVLVRDSDVYYCMIPETRFVTFRAALVRSVRRAIRSTNMLLASGSGIDGGNTGLRKGWRASQPCLKHGTLWTLHRLVKNMYDVMERPAALVGSSPSIGLRVGGRLPSQGPHQRRKKTTALQLLELD